MLEGSPEPDPNLRALRSIDAVYSADAAELNEQLIRLRRFVRIRRPLYYSVLLPASALSRISPLLVLISGAVAVIGFFIALFAAAPPIVIFLLMYWAIAALLYHALSVRLAALMDDAATSVGLTSADVLAMWKG